MPLAPSIRRSEAFFLVAILGAVPCLGVLFAGSDAMCMRVAIEGSGTFVFNKADIGIAPWRIEYC